MRVLKDGDRVVVLARSLEDQDGNVFIEPWSPALLPAHRVAEHGARPHSIPVRGWPAGPVVVDDVVVGGETVPGQVWRIEGTWRSGTVEFISRTLTEHPQAKLFHQGPSPTAGRPRTWTTPLDTAQQNVLEQKRAEGLVVANWPIKKPNGDVVLSIVTSDPTAVRDALRSAVGSSRCPSTNRPGRPPPSRPPAMRSSNTAMSGTCTRSAGGRGSDGRPLALRASLAWLEPESLTLLPVDATRATRAGGVDQPS